MMLQIIMEIVLAVATYIIARQFWQCIKRDKYLGQVMSNQSHLESFISRGRLESPAPIIALSAQPNEVGYGINLMVVSVADRTATRRIKIFYAATLIFVAVAGYFVEQTYIAFTLMLFLAWFEPLCHPAQTNVLQHVLALALILYKWHMKDPAACEKFVEQASSLRSLYNVVKNLK